MAGRPRTHTFWVEQIRKHVRNKRSLSAAVIRRLLAKEKSPAEAGNVPDARTIRRIIVDFRGIPEPAQKRYEFFQWPESMISEDLPWEASRAALDLLNWHFEHREPPPIISQALWFWRFTLAAPDAPIEYRVEMARHYSEVDIAEFQGIARYTEASLAQRGWIEEVKPESPVLCQICRRGKTFDLGHGLWHCSVCGYTGGPDKKETPDLPGFNEHIHSTNSAMQSDRSKEQKKGTVHGRQRKKKGR